MYQIILIAAYFTSFWLQKNLNSHYTQKFKRLYCSLKPQIYTLVLKISDIQKSDSDLVCMSNLKLNILHYTTHILNLKLVLVVFTKPIWVLNICIITLQEMVYIPKVKLCCHRYALKNLIVKSSLNSVEARSDLSI